VLDNTERERERERKGRGGWEEINLQSYLFSYNFKKND